MKTKLVVLGAAALASMLVAGVAEARGGRGHGWNGGGHGFRHHHRFHRGYIGFHRYYGPDCYWRHTRFGWKKFCTW